MKYHSLSVEEDNQSFSPLTPLSKEPRNLFATAKENLKSAGFFLAGFDDAELRNNCKPGEKNTALVKGALQALNFCFVAGEASFIGHYLAGSPFNPVIVAGSALLAAFMGAADHIAFVRAAGFPQGMKSLLYGGFPIRIPIGSDKASRVCIYARATVSVLFALTTATVAGLEINDAAIKRQIRIAALQQNLPLAQRTDKSADSQHQAELTRYEMAISREQRDEATYDRWMKQAGRSSSKAVTARLAESETRLTQSRADVVARKHELDAGDATRAGKMENALKQSPLYIPPNEGLDGKVRALFSEIADDPWAAVPLLIIALILASFDILLLMVLKGISMPSEYFMGETRRHLAALVREAKAAEAATSHGAWRQLPPAAASPEPPPDDPPPQGPLGAGAAGRKKPPPDDNPPNNPPGAGAAARPALPSDDISLHGQQAGLASQPRRGRGRPRKLYANANAGASHG